MNRSGARIVAAAILGCAAGLAPADEADCDGNNVPDSFEVATARQYRTGTYGVYQDRYEYPFGTLARSDEDVTLYVEILAWRFNGPDRYVDVEFNGKIIARLFDDDGGGCARVAREYVTLAWTDAPDLSDVMVVLHVHGEPCSTTPGVIPAITCTIEYYEHSPLDVNQNGILDSCDLSLADLDADGSVGLRDIERFVELFLDRDPKIDLIDDDVLNMNDIRAFVDAYVIAST